MNNIVFEYNLEDIVYNILGEKAIIIYRRITEINTNIYDIEYCIDLGSDIKWVSGASLFEEKPI